MRALLLLIPVLAAAGLAGCRPEPEPVNRLMDAQTRDLLMMGTAALERQEFELALALADSADRHAPNTPGVYFLRGIIHAEMARLDESDAAYRRVLELQPDYPGAWNNLGNNAYSRQSFRDAIVLYRRELERENAPIPWRGIGRAYRELSRPDSAGLAFREAIRADSLYAPAYVSLAQLHEEAGDYDRALEQARRALALNPDSPEAQYLVGSLLVRASRFEEAVPLLRRVAEAWPWHQPSFYNLGVAFQRMGREAEAKALLDQSERLRVQQDRVETMEKMVRNNPTDPYVHAGLGSALRLIGRHTDALHAYRVALHLDPGNLEFRNNVALLHLTRGDQDEAIRWLEGIVRDDPKQADAWLNLGVIYARAGRADDARRAWQATLRQRPDDPAARAYLARLGG